MEGPDAEARMRVGVSPLIELRNYGIIHPLSLRFPKLEGLCQKVVAITYIHSGT